MHNILSSLMIFSALRGQLLIFCRNGFIVSMECATSERTRRESRLQLASELGMGTGLC